ncbi:YcjF family protein [Wenxinia saemankumensis]|uniref:Putative membrane protein n=1 Tax=Wenxinia saemankumensis TaxID=1447782 RepID=A0A1M6CD45_9RHOB|nr:TIGR01620 family protein [Wenxinia saemankumensis]SHI58731.1 putative membrane protein [Wenxinia saemankumensis]
MTETRTGPVLIDLDAEAEAARPETAPPVPDVAPAGRGSAMAQAARLAARRPSRLGTLFWGLAGALLSFVVTVAAWSWIGALMAAYPALGWMAAVLTLSFLVVLLLMAGREMAALLRLGRIDHLRAEAEAAVAQDDLKAARRVAAGVERLYAGRPDAAWGLARLKDRKEDIFDADGLLGLVETDLLAPLDLAAMREVEGAARQVATVTAVVPLALADVVAALTANVRMIRRVAEIYGGRSGTIGGWRLTRAVMTHLVATGAVAVGDDLIHSVAGGSLLTRLSRRFGEGVVNGALTARVGVAAMEVCRPLPFVAVARPSVSALVGRALAGLFGSGREDAPDRD